MVDISISVVMPVFNSAAYLPSAIESILNQSFLDFEIIVIYDESDDDSLRILHEYSRRDSRLKIISGDNTGIIGALNKGISHANGAFIARMDADDISLPSRFQKQLNVILKEDADICGCNFALIDGCGKIVDYRIVPTTHLTILLELSRCVPFAHGSVLIRKRFLNDHNLKYGSEIYSDTEDYDLWTRMYNSGAKFANVNDCLFYYRVHGTSLSMRKRKLVAINNTRISYSFLVANRKRIQDEIVDGAPSSLSVREEETRVFLVFSLAILFFNFSLLSKLKFYSYRSLIMGSSRALAYAAAILKFRAFGV